MNSEESRLRTFANWPENAPVDPKKVAKAGFYYTGRELEVQCFSCGSRVAEWNYGDQVMGRHKALDPRCRFVRNLRESGNVPLRSRNGEQSTSMEHRRGSDNSHVAEEIADNSYVAGEEVSQFQDETRRLASFSGWPIPSTVTPTRLAAAGFFYTNQQTKVMCAFCKGVVGKWEPGCDPELIHRIYYPKCKYITDRLKYRAKPYSNITIRGFGPINESEEIEALRALGVLYHRTPKNPKYLTASARLKTFSRWSSLFNQRPEILVDAGFYYTGIGDKVRCFHCDGGLEDWKKTDDPWIEHAVWFSNCVYVALTKGSDFVQEALLMIPQSLRMMESALQTPQVYEVSEETIQTHMTSSAAIMALEMGIEASRVKRALRQRFRSTGKPFEEDETHLLISFCMDIQSEEGIGEPSSGPPLRSRRVSEVRDHIPPEESEDSEMEDSTEAPIIQVLDRTVAPAAVDKSNKITTEEPKIKDLSSEVSMEEENRLLKEARLCKVCLDREVVIVFLPCAHLVTCAECAKNLVDCPLCRQPIRATVRTYLS